MKKILAVFVFFLLAVCTLANAKDWKEIRFAVDPTYAPFESKGADGKFVGFDIDLGTEICKRLNAKCVWIEGDFDNMIAGLKAKKFDGILSSMSITDERLKEIAFSDKLFDAPTRMVARIDSGLLPNPASLKGKRVGVQQGTTQEAYAKTHWANVGVEVISYPTQTQVLLDLKQGRLDASLQDAVQAFSGFLQTPEGKGFAFAGPNVVDPKMPSSGTAIGLRKEDTDLKNAIDQAIAAMIKDKTYKKMARKYFSFDIYGK